MCASYGIDLVEPRAAAGRQVRFERVPPLDRAEQAARLEQWVDDQQGRARITGRVARNLNPLIHAPDATRELTFGWWWLHVGPAPAEYSAFNSRDDKLLRSWREPFQRRALLPASWYIEKGRRFALPDDEPFAIASITTPVMRAGEAPFVSYSMVTRGAIAAAASVHDRMPLVLPRELHEPWLDRRISGDARLLGEALQASEKLSARLSIIGEDRGAAKPDPRPQPTLF